MKYAAAILSLMLALGAQAQRLTIREENDVWTGSDSSYTQGLELEYMGEATVIRDRVSRVGVGLRNLMYTPEDITIAEDQPDDRPWAGLTAVALKLQQQHSKDLVEHQLLIGVTGEWSYSEEIQTWFHQLIGVHTPEGWANQIPNEVVVNYAVTGLHPFDSVGKADTWSADVSGIYGGAVGTAYDYGEAGILGRAGWNMPNRRLGLITPSSIFGWEPVAYVFGRVSGRYVLHNISIDGSWFQDGPSQELEPFVTDMQVGLSLGLESFKYDGQLYNVLLSIATTRRSDEFQGQDNVTDFTTINLSIGADF